MKITSINVPESYVRAIECLVGEDGLYPSRSEVVRIAVREMLQKRLSLAKESNRIVRPEDIEPSTNPDQGDYVRVPSETLKGKTFTTYKIVRKLEHVAEPTPKAKSKRSTERRPRRTRKGIGSIGNIFHPEFNHVEHFEEIYKK